MIMSEMPTLIVGLGGIGGRIADSTFRKLSDDQKKYVGAVAFDTDQGELKKLSITTIQISDERLVKDLLGKNIDYMKWFPANKFTANKGTLKGAGQIRAISRLSALVAEKENRFIPLEEEIRRILEHDGNKDISNFNVFFVGSITGGTGAGMFLQMPFYIKNLVKEQFAIENIYVRGMFMNADITKNEQPNKINRDAVMVNAYACIKELNAFYLTQIEDDEENHLELNYYKKGKRADRERELIQDYAENYADELFEDDIWQDDTEAMRNDMRNIAAEGSNIPYNAFYLIEGTDSTGGIGNTNIYVVTEHISRMVYTLLFTPIRDRAEGVLDNSVLADMECGGMNRYNSAGLCILRFPYKEVEDYVTLRWISELVKEEWLLLDVEYEQIKREMMRQQRSDPSAIVPEIEEKYTELFRDHTYRKKEAKLAFLYKEMFIDNPDDANQPYSKSDILIREIKRRIQRIFDNDANITQIKEESEADYKKLLKLDTAEKEAERLYDAVEDMSNAVDLLVKNHKIDIANEVFPTSALSMKMNKNNDLNIYKNISATHPVAARFFCYDLVMKLKRELSSLKRQHEAVDLELLENMDFYGTAEDGKQNAMDAISFIKINKIPIIRNGKGALKRIARSLPDAIRAQNELYLTFGKEEIMINTFEVLLKRFEQFSEYYSRFFDNIAKEITENEEKIRMLENGFEHNPYGERLLFCSSKSLNYLFNEFRVKNTFDLPKETKQSIFEGIFDITSKMINSKDKELSETQLRKRTENNEKRLAALFDTGIVDSLKAIVIDKGRGVINFSAKAAIEHELQLEKQIYPDDEGYENARLVYERERIEKAFSIAAPMFSVAKKTDFTETVYLALNPESAELRAGVPDKGMTRQNLVPNKTEATDLKPVTVLMEDAFSPYEIICFRLKHNYMVEELTKFMPGSEFANAYNTRIANLGKNPTGEDADAYKTVVNPHLNRFWHEEGFVPSLGFKERKQRKTNVLKAFIYGLGLDLFVKICNEETDYKTIWCFKVGNKLIPIRKAGVLISSDYAALLDSLLYNKRIVSYILRIANMDIKQTKGYNSPSDLINTIFNTRLILDLCQITTDEEKDENILDIIMQMYPLMPQKKWDRVFYGIKEVLFEYLGKLFEDNERLINKAYPQILDMIINNSKVGKNTFDQEKYELASKKIKNNIEEIKRKKFI
ncbi:MAG: hypothetical protein IJH65_08885 [Methanobrevibacter sp.]|nr:hypothetical protein [Methanobrevibacter sp.]